jgi:hypothetical protein
MSVAGRGDQCLLSFGGKQFLLQSPESPELRQELHQILARKAVLWLDGDTPYRCVGAAIITLQDAKVKFRAPQIPR